ncbi:MAG: [protein-PII] uridylyltransferase [Methylococcales bacterium]
MKKVFNLNPDDIFKQEKPHAALKEIIAERNKQQSEAFNPLKNVENLLIENSAFIDDVLILSWNHFLKQHSSQLCLLATGGYARNELFPNSDIDILILLENTETHEFQDSLSSFSNFLWDIGLKPGQSVRTISECFQAAKNDQTIMTNLLEIRLISGNPNLFSTLSKQVSEAKLWSSADYFSAKMQEQNQRHAKYHDTEYNLEPNIKEGPGGLRDLQNIAWVFKHHYKSSSLKELIKYGLFSATEYKELTACRDILWRIRYALHTLTKSSKEQLAFDHQRELATQFNFVDTNNNPDVEQFMQLYFKTVTELSRINEILLQLFSERLLDTQTIKQLSPPNDHFYSINNYIEVKDSETFNKHPLALLEIFTLLQHQKTLVGVRASTIRLIRKNLHLIDDDFRNNPKAINLFLAILKAPRGITHQLRRMNRYGMLAIYLPSFANIVGRMQYDLFHTYTVDAHTLFVLRNLRRLSLEKHQDELPFCNSIFLRIKKPELLYITALFHDIAKGMGGNHSVLGEEIAKQFCIQHKLSKHDSKLISWLVRNHLVMSMTAQRKDISDPNVIHKFALLVGNTENLDHLYLFTVADIRATNPNLWNSWKDSLLLELYTLTHSALRRGLQNPMERTERLYENKQEARDELIGRGISEATIQKTWNKINDDYFLRYSADEITWHTIAIAASEKEDLPLVILRPQNQRGSVEIFVYTKNENKIFSLSAKTLDSLGLTILDARIITINLTPTDQYVLNSFQVLEQSGEPITNLDRELHICKSLNNNLKNLSVAENINIHRQSRQARHFPINTKINFHKDPLSRYTVIEIITTDCSGLLATIGQAFIDLNIQLHDAKINTIGSRVEDMFYVTDINLKPITKEPELKKIQDKLFSVLKQD